MGQAFGPAFLRSAKFRFANSIGRYTRNSKPNFELFFRIGKDREIYQRALFQLMSSAQQQVLFENTARAMGDAPDEIKLRHIGNCAKADSVYGEGVAKALGLAGVWPRRLL